MFHCLCYYVLLFVIVLYVPLFVSFCSVFCYSMYVPLFVIVQYVPLFVIVLYVQLFVFLYTVYSDVVYNTTIIGNINIILFVSSIKTINIFDCIFPQYNNEATYIILFNLQGICLRYQV